MELKTLVNGKLIRFILLMLAVSLTASCSYDLEGYPNAGQAYVVSVSSDGSYAVTSNSGKKIILWDIKNKTNKIISTNANIYSAYFIKNSDMFMWQDLNDIVHVQNVYGKEILSFHNFPTYGHVMSSDLKHYFASNDNLDLYGDYGKKQHLILTNGNHGGFWGLGKLLNLTISNDNQFLLTSGWGGDYKPFEFNNDDGVALWNAITEQPIRKFSGNEAKTIATISPNSKYVVAGDENSIIYVWKTINGQKLFQLDNSFGKLNCVTLPNKLMRCSTNHAGYPKIPTDYVDGFGMRDDKVMNLKFVDLSSHYLRFIITTPYAILYQIDNSEPIKYLDLGKYPSQISRSSDYSRDEAIDTAPSANILVIAQADGPGIIVYKFDPKTLTLNKIWAPGADFSHLMKLGLMSFLISLFFCLLLNLGKYPTTEKVIAGVALTLLLLSVFPLYAYGCSAILAGIISSIISSHFLNLTTVSSKKLKLIKHSQH